MLSQKAKYAETRINTRFREVAQMAQMKSTPHTQSLLPTKYAFISFLFLIPSIEVDLICDFCARHSNPHKYCVSEVFSKCDAFVTPPRNFVTPLENLVFMRV